MPEAFDAAVANAGTGGAAFAGDAFTDSGSNARFMPFTVLCMPDGAGYDRITSAAGLPVVAQTGATFPVSAVSLPLPNGASTAAKQPALGVAGTASADVITVQGVTSMTPLKVDGSGVTQPVSGTVTANAGTGTHTVAGTVIADAGTGTFAVSAAALPLPSGASTAAKQPALGTAGTPASDVITVQGTTSMTPLKVDASATTQPISGTITANAGTGTFAVSAASLPLPTGAATAALQYDVGIAGTPATDVVTVQGVSGMTALKVDASATTQPISGTVTANAGSGTMAVSASALPLPSGASTAAKQPALGTAGTAAADVITVQGITSMTPLKVDGSGVTQPISIASTVGVSASSLPLPSGASTAAKQPALGSAGSASTDVLTVQGISSMTALKVDGSGVTQPVSGTLTVNAGSGTLAVSASTLPLPSGAALESKQPGYGSAGSPSDNCVSVQGHSGMTAVLVDGSSVTQPVSGSVTANAGSGTFAVSASNLPLPTGAATSARQPAVGIAGSSASDVLTVQGIASMTPLAISGTVTANAGTGTQAISAASLPLPTGAATSSKQPTLGIAGTPASDVITVQGTSGMTAINVAEGGAALASLQLIDDVVFAEDAAAVGGDKGVQVLAVRGDTPANTSGTNGDYEPLQVKDGLLWTRPRGAQDSGGTDMTDTSNHALKVNVVAGATSGSQYTEDAAAASDPIGNATIVVRDDVRVGNLTSADGDNVALRGTNYGELYVKHVDSLPVTGTVTVDAGSNTSTASLARESGGNLATIASAVKAEDSASNDGDKGFVVHARRSNTPNNTSGSDGDYEPLQTQDGLLWTRPRGMQDSGGTDITDTGTHALNVKIVAGGGSGGTSAVDDAAFTVATGTGTPIMGIVTSDSVDSGDAGVLSMLANRQLKVTLFDSGGTELAVGGGTQYTEDAASAANPIGNVPMLVRSDTPATQVSADGDNIAQRGTNYGAAYVTLLDSSGSTVSVGGGTQYVEDDAAASNPTGNMLLARRKDTLSAAEVSADGDNIALNATSKGQLQVKLADTIVVDASGTAINVNSHAVTNAGTFAVQAAQSGTWTVQPGNTANTTAWLVTGSGGTFPATQSGTWNVTNVSGTISLPTGASTAANQTTVQTPISPASATATKATLLGCQYNSTQATFTDGQQGSLQCSSHGAAFVATGTDTFNVTVNAALPAGSNVIGGVTQSGSWSLSANQTVDLNKLAGTTTDTNSGAKSAGTLRVVLATDQPQLTNKLLVTPDANSQVDLNKLSGNTVSTGNGASGTGVLRVAQVNDGTGVLAAVTTLTGSGVAHDAADSGNPHKIGGKARTTNPTAVSDADRVDATFDKLGRIVARTGQVRELVTDGGTITISSTSETTVLGAGASGVFHDLTLILVNNTSATDVRVDFRDATGGTVRFPVFAPAGQMTGFTPPRPVKQATAANNWTAQLSASVTDVRIFAQADKEV